MRLKLIFSFILIVLVSIASVSLIARIGTAREVHAVMLGDTSNTRGLVSELQTYYQARHGWEGAGSLLGKPGHGPGGMGKGMGQHLRLADDRGVIVADSAAAPAGQLTAEEMGRAIPIEVDEEIVGYLLSEGGMGFAPGSESMLLYRLNRAALIAGLIGGGLSLLLGLALAYGLLRPVSELTRAASRLAKGDLSQRVAVRGKDELAMLAATFNRMAESLERAENARRALTADIAHELRNPLAVQRASLEAIQDGVYPLSLESLQPILEQNHLLTRLVEDLRTLALADAGQLQLERTPTDIPALVERILDRFAPQASAQSVKLTLSTPPTPPPLLLADPMRLEQIIGNLLSNALRYTPPGGSIECVITLQRAALSLTIHDAGPGIPAEALPHIFERFYRADKSRSRAEGGSGLGLAIARQLAEAHGGTLTAANHPAGGAVFTLLLPLSDSVQPER